MNKTAEELSNYFENEYSKRFVDTDIKLTINGKDIPVGCELAGDIVRGLSDSEDYLDLFLELSKSSNYEIRNQIGLKNNISEEIINNLLENKTDFDLLRHLLVNEAACKIFTTDHLLKMIDTNITDLLAGIGLLYFDSMPNCDRNVILSLLAKHPEPYIRLSVALNKETPNEILNYLKKDKDYKVFETSQKTLKNKKSDEK